MKKVLPYWDAKIRALDIKLEEIKSRQVLAKITARNEIDKAPYV